MTTEQENERAFWSNTQPLSRTEPRRPAAFPRTDAGNAELFAHLHGESLRYDHRRNRWLLWQGHRWAYDVEAQVMQLAIDAMRQRYLDAMLLADADERMAQSKFANLSENRQRLEAMLALARSQPSIRDRGDAWDTDHWLLGAANGVVDLRKGELIAGDPGQKVTLFTPVRFDPEATAPRWLQFLDEIFGGDQALIDFVWKAIGYSLTGDTSEQCVFVCHGQGANGKSVLLSLLRSLAGSYSYNAPFSVFELNQRASTGNDVAPLANARLVTASETNIGVRLNEARLKALTGNDPISARYLYGEYFTFYSQAKFWLAVNHRPRVEDQSLGFWRRMRMIPFLQTFEDNRDKGLEAKLLRELPGILAWAVRGCVAWQAEGLSIPEVVVNATEDYRQDSDPLGQFLAERCFIRSDASCGASEAYSAYAGWAYERSLKQTEKLSTTAFGTKLGERFEKKRSAQGVFYVGFGLLGHAPPGPPDPAAVQGSVQGFESDVGSSPLLSPVNVLTREVIEEPFTTLHPYTSNDLPVPQTAASRRCACGQEISLLNTKGVCGRCQPAGGPT